MHTDVYYAKLITLLTALLVPIYFIGLVLLIPQLTTFILPFPISPLLIKIITGLVVSIPWLFLIYELRNILPLTLIELKNTTSLVPLRWKLFYGVNSLLIGVFFVIPLITPFFTIFMCIIIAGRLTGRIVDIDTHKALGAFVFIASLLFLLFSLGYFVVILVFSNLFSIIFSLVSLWFQNIQLIAIFSIWIANSLAYGSFAEIIFLYKIHKEIDSIGLKLTDVSYNFIRTIEFLVFLFLSMSWLFLNELGTRILFFSNIISFIITIIIFAIGIFGGIKKKRSTINALGILVAAAFVGIYVYQQLNPIAITILLIISSIIFYGLFFYCMYIVIKHKQT